MLCYLLELDNWFPAMRVFQYITVRALAGAATAFCIMLFTGPRLIAFLRRICTGESARYCADAPAIESLREKKKTTPTMGGLLIIVAISISTLLWSRLDNWLVWLVLATLCFMGAVGFADDYVKVVRRKPKGLSAGRKLLLETAWVAVVAAVMWSLPDMRAGLQQLMVPFMKTPLLQDMGPALSFLVMAAVVVGASNAVNLTDGLDGLAIGCTSTVAFAYLVMAYAAGHAVFAKYLLIPLVPGAGELAVFCGCIMGAALGFLWFNCHPAEVFMGDTGSLALGGAIGMVAVLIKQEISLIFVGGVFVMEALSVILQVASFKLTGRRIFLCSPLHHHFEIRKDRPWSETQITIRFWIMSIICALAGILLLKIR